MTAATWCSRLCGMFLLALSWACAAGDRALDATAVTASIQLASHFDILDDADGRLSFDEVRDPANAARFRPAEEGTSSLNFGFTRSAIWVRLRLTNPGEAALSRLIEIAYARLYSVQWFAPDATGRYSQVDTGYSRPMTSRPLYNRFFVFPLTLPPQSEQIVYLRLQTPTAFFVPARLWAPEAFRRYELNDSLRQGAFFGIALAITLFNLLLYLTLRDATYLLYVAFASGVIVLFAALTGIGFQFLWDDSPFWATLSTPTSASFAGITLLLFARRMMGTDRLMPRLDPWIKGLMALIAVQMAVLPFAFGTVIRFNAAILSLVAGLVLLVGVIAMIRGDHSARYFVAAFAVLLALGALNALEIFRVLPGGTIHSGMGQDAWLLQMMLLALALGDRYKQLVRDKESAQAETLAVQAQLVETLKSSEKALEERVRQRTNELEATLNDLKATQNQLIHSEKMASLGQLVANVAHEINTPIGAVKSSGRNIVDALDQALANLPILLQYLTETERVLFLTLIDQARHAGEVLSTREERALARQIAQDLDAIGVADSRRKAAFLAALRIGDAHLRLRPLLCHPQSEFILDTASSLASIISNADNINVAVERVSKIVFALKSFSRIDTAGEMHEADLREGVETVLTIYQNQLKQGIELVRQFEDIPPLRCLPDELNQVWTNLIHNALQAMNYRGTLTIAIRKAGNEIVVSVGDTGCGIPDAIRDRIFDPFFTTKPAGEGSGLGLDIVKKIVDKHGGRIEIESRECVGTTFHVRLPLEPASP